MKSSCITLCAWPQYNTPYLFVSALGLLNPNWEHTALSRDPRDTTALLYSISSCPSLSSAPLTHPSPWACLHCCWLTPHGTKTDWLCLLGIPWPSINPSWLLLWKQPSTARTSAGSCCCLPQCCCPAWNTGGPLLHFCSSGFKQKELYVCVLCLNFNEGMFLPMLQSGD